MSRKGLGMVGKAAYAEKLKLDNWTAGQPDSWKTGRLDRLDCKGGLYTLQAGQLSN